ncbi:M20 family metallopeptidase [Haladaptatus salinisoli]|uniref:M20 family metallopeptidase n=1 Tax=Haladaptatus salinisoli TaxID=2884876 RepID=UPI001D0A7CAB|nr:M20/M25/M40 family metallo-hydrolase [Haladaptatus salinisoli]
MDELVELTHDLVSIPSHEGETAAGDYIEEWLRAETDADVTRDGVGNVIARRATDSPAASEGVGAPGEGSESASPDADREGSSTSLALVGHHDVVPPAASQVEDGEYVVEGRDGRLYGRGTADMKGSVVASMLAFRDANPACELVFASFVGEELGGNGVRHAIGHGFSPDYAIVAEGSTNYSKQGVTDVVVAHRGRRASTLTASGTAAHASEPDAGKNAIYRACDAVGIVRDCEVPTVSVLGHDISGSVVVTEIDGGSAWNVIPDTCEVTVDERTVPGEHADLGSVEEVEGVEWTVEQDLPPMECDDAEFAETVLAAARDAQDGDPEHVTKPHATDAGWLAQAGTTCVVCGASEPGEAHTKDESVSVDVLRRCYRIYRNAAERVS